MLIRPATEQDFPAIRELIHQENLNPMGLDWRRFLVAVDQAGQVIGCGQIKVHRDSSLELASIAVIPEQRGKGIARAMIEALLNDRRDTIYLTCRARLGPFYQKFGFKPIPTGEMPGYFRMASSLFRLLHFLHIVREDLLVMRKTPSAIQPEIMENIPRTSHLHE